MPNRLIHETSPYLRQHAENPVDWYPWGDEALRRAREEDRPILLSIGYSACHWCHVMERESFEDPETARIMNEHFVNIKVDREERPDLDHIYMEAVQAMAGHGGWPLHVFLTPEGVPFYGGTYFPPQDRPGMPSFRRVLLAIADAWRNRREEVRQAGQQARAFLQQQAAPPPPSPEPLTASVLDRTYQALRLGFDSLHGGFGAAPKFPQPMVLEFLLRTFLRTGDGDALNMVQTTLDRMARGGIYDQVGGGFHRYSVDSRWLVPHFEKMLYDNAQLARLYLEAHLSTGNAVFRRVAEETLDYVLREMRSPEGAFYSTQDADSEGVEGKFYLWTPREVQEVLGPEEAAVICRYFDITEDGNFEGKNILHVPRAPHEVAAELGLAPEELDKTVQRARSRLLEARSLRVWPGRDDKVLASWNGLMVRALAQASSALGREDYRQAATLAAEAILGRHWKDGRLMRTSKDGQVKVAGFLDDYAHTADGLLALYEATFELRWLQHARELADAILDLFWDDDQQALYDTSPEHEQLVARPRDIYDNATPSGHSVAVEVLLKLAILSGESRYQRIAAHVLRPMAEPMARYPSAFGRLLCALDFYLSSPKEVAVVGDPSASDTQALLRVIHGRYLPNKVVALARPGDELSPKAIPLLEGRASLGGQATAYVCRDYVCQSPVTDPGALAKQLDER